MSDWWDDDDDLAPRTRRRKGNPWFARIVLSVVLVAFVGMVAWGALSLIGGDKTTTKRVVNITLVAPPPPPPPPPPPEVKPPEPEVKEEVKLPEPEQQQAEEAAPVNEALGLDADGSGGGDGFGLAAKKGGKDITELGGPLTTDRARFAWFTGIVQDQLREHFQKNDKLRRADYRVVVRVWFTDDGRIDRYELVGSSGKPEIDRDLKLSMEDMPRLKQSPPADMPQPIKLRVTSRGTG